MSKGFDTRWGEAILLISETPQDDVLESLYKMRIRDSELLKTVLAPYDQDIEQKDFPPSYQKLKNHGKEVLGSKDTESRI